MSFGIFLAKVLNRLGLLSKVNLTVGRKIVGTSFSIPIIRRAGFDHLYGPTDTDYFIYKHFSSQLAKGVFVDIGANIGQTAVRAFVANPKQHVISFEPNKFCVDYLQQFKKANPHLNLTIVPKAISDADGIQKLYLNSELDTSASLDRDGRQGFFDGAKVIEVDCISGETVSKIVGGSASFVKIDVEGAELIVLKALKGLIQRDKPVIYCEVLDAHDDKSVAGNIEMKNAIKAFIINELAYSIFRFDTQRNTLDPVDDFPVRLFRKENLDACNYILMPAGV
jgi:FkbM family methyltransferase